MECVQADPQGSRPAAARGSLLGPGPHPRVGFTEAKISPPERAHPGLERWDRGTAHLVPVTLKGRAAHIWTLSEESLSTRLNDGLEKGSPITGRSVRLSAVKAFPLF